MNIKRLLLAIAIIALIGSCTRKEIRHITYPRSYVSVLPQYVAVNENFVHLTDSFCVFTEEIVLPADLEKINRVSLPVDSLIHQDSYYYIPAGFVDQTDSSQVVIYEISRYDPAFKVKDQRTINWWAIWMVFLAIIMLAVLAAILYFMGMTIWVRAKFSGVSIGLWRLSVMRFQKVPPEKVIELLIKSSEAKVTVTERDLVNHYLAGGNIEIVVDALIAAQKADTELDRKLNLTFEILANIDLAGFEVKKAVHEAINYQVLETDGITGYALDGVQLNMKAKITIQPQIRKLIGNAGPETVVARVDEGLATSIGKAGSHYDILKNPFFVADEVLKDPEITVDTAYRVISIDISDIKVGKDIHAELAKERAEADKERAEAKRQQALATEQEMKAKAQEARVRLIEAEVGVQKAMAAAFLDGNLSIHDYHQMQNTEADTKMRNALSKSQHKSDDDGIIKK